MKVSHVAYAQTEKSKQNGDFALTPELLAATGARYSRNKEGLRAIVAKIDWNNLDKSVDGIFRMVDYGHASIADMATVAMFIDDMSLYAAYYMWSISPTASGQESSTRYIEINSKSVCSPTELGLKDSKGYLAHIKKSFEAYEKAVRLWGEIATLEPQITNFPQEVLDDKTEKGQKRLERMKRNFVFDRARVFLPAAAKTNIMMVMSARSWVEVISNLLSHPLLELNTIGLELKKGLELSAPRLVKHAVAKDATKNVLQSDFEALKKAKANTKNDGAYLKIYTDKKLNLKKYCVGRVNRYSNFGRELTMLPVKFGWKKIAFGELRDLNRHRTGSKNTVFAPNGFYDATDVAPTATFAKKISVVSKYSNTLVAKMNKLIAKNDPTYVYLMQLGHTVSFEHVTTLDKYIYEAELRTGIGSHYKYCEHLKNTLKILYKLQPELRGVIFEGTAEPE